MGITADFDIGDINQSNEELVAEVEKKVIMAMQYAGEDFVAACREQPQGHELGFYNDRTANLRNSVGYLIYKYGELVHESATRFPAENRTTVADLIDKGAIMLIGIAGMDYASYVESKGYNVITIQRDQLFVDLEIYFKDIQVAIEKYGNK